MFFPTLVAPSLGSISRARIVNMHVFINPSGTLFNGHYQSQKSIQSKVLDSWRHLVAILCIKINNFSSPYSNQCFMEMENCRARSLGGVQRKYYGKCGEPKQSPRHYLYKRSNQYNLSTRGNSTKITYAIPFQEIHIQFFKVSHTILKRV